MSFPVRLHCPCCLTGSVVDTGQRGEAERCGMKNQRGCLTGRAIQVDKAVAVGPAGNMPPQEPDVAVDALIAAPQAVKRAAEAALDRCEALTASLHLPQLVPVLDEALTRAVSRLEALIRALAAPDTATTRSGAPPQHLLRLPLATAAARSAVCAADADARRRLAALAPLAAAAAAGGGDALEAEVRRAVPDQRADVVLWRLLDSPADAEALAVAQQRMTDLILPKAFAAVASVEGAVEGILLGVLRRPCKEALEEVLHPNPAIPRVLPQSHRAAERACRVGMRDRQRIHTHVRWYRTIGRGPQKLSCNLDSVFFLDLSPKTYTRAPFQMADVAVGVQHGAHLAGDGPGARPRGGHPVPLRLCNDGRGLPHHAAAAARGARARGGAPGRWRQHHRERQHARDGVARPRRVRHRGGAAAARAGRAETRLQGAARCIAPQLEGASAGRIPAGRAAACRATSDTMMW